VQEFSKNINNKTKKNYPKELLKRLLSEQNYHDRKYATEGSYPPHYKIYPTYSIFIKIKEKLGDINGKRVIEYGC